MTVIAAHALQSRPIDDDFWPALAGRATAWLRDNGLAARDAVVVLPTTDWLPVARRAFARQGGWQPRIETPRTLLASRGPGLPASVDQIGTDARTDRLNASLLLRSQTWGQRWARRDPRGFEHAVDAVIDTGRGLAQASHSLPPGHRDGWWNLARAGLDRVAPLGPAAAVGGSERLLARVALEWAAAADPPAEDALFGLRPSAWVSVRAGGPSPFIDSLLAASDAPVLVLDCDPPASEPFCFAAVAASSGPRRWVCDDFEAEAQAAATEVLQALARGARPVAVIAHDRLLVRRVRALLERAQVRLRDETGWKLSTTRAAASVMAMLRAVSPTASADARLDWLKADAVGRAAPAALQALEAHWRGGPPSAAADALWGRAQRRLAAFDTASRQPLSDWLERLRLAMTAPVDERRFEQDDAGRQLLAALRIDGTPCDEGWRLAARQTVLDFDGFTGWVDTTLEAATYLPPADDDAQVVVTPLGRAALRPFGACVFAGTDEKRLGAGGAKPGLMPSTLAVTLGLDDARVRAARDMLAFALLLRLPDVVLLRRRVEGNELLAASPWVERAALAARRAGRPWSDEVDWQPLERSVPAQPVWRPAPVADAVPARLSASTVEALRDCPYRFFARAVLRLTEPAELDAELEKRDYGSWLHAVLHRFHATRSRPDTQVAEVARLHAVADDVRQEVGLDAARLLPFRAGFASLAPLYIQWLHRRDVAGWAFEDGEIARSVEPPVLGGVLLHGRIDRIDEGPLGVQLIDYKTGSADDLKRRRRSPLEDTQLPFYAVLAPTTKPLHAIYLALDDREGPIEIPHAGVVDTARLLLDGLAGDLDAMRRGTGLAALGEGPVCDHCEARGLCRRDHWSATA